MIMQWKWLIQEITNNEEGNVHMAARLLHEPFWKYSIELDFSEKFLYIALKNKRLVENRAGNTGSLQQPTGR